MTADSELDAAGIEGAALRESYRRCRALNAAHGRTYYLATLLLPPAKRPYVHALYGFARFADDIVDDLSPGVPPRLGPRGWRPGTRTSSPTSTGVRPAIRSAGRCSTPSRAGRSRWTT